MQRVRETGWRKRLSGSQHSVIHFVKFCLVIILISFIVISITVVTHSNRPISETVFTYGKNG
ncbi:MAG TPA: hypothetical protein DIT05_05780 [Morganella sp. (in: Bacteria)]|nr:hypothetical protein AYY16_05555 [Morganella psychrotolerans]HCM62043.1 hypothetical protein [Morganella sp. (in: enterobacteria)]